MAQKMTPQMELFCQEYLVDLNGTQAAIRAGYSSKSAAAQASWLLTRDDVKDRVQELFMSRSIRTEITADMVLRELALIGFANAGDYFEWSESGVRLIPSDDLTPAQKAAVQEISESTSQQGGTIRLKLYDKRSALVDIGRHLGMFVDKHEVTGKDGGPIEVNETNHKEEFFNKLDAMNPAQSDQVH